MPRQPRRAGRDDGLGPAADAECVHVPHRYVVVWGQHSGLCTMVGRAAHILCLLEPALVSALCAYAGYIMPHAKDGRSSRCPSGPPAEHLS